MQTSDIVSATEHIFALRNYPRKQAYLLAAIEDIARHFGSIPKQAEPLILEYFAVETLPKELMDQLIHKHVDSKQVIEVCSGPLCFKAGSDQLATELADTLTGAIIERRHCMGNCHQPPTVKIGERLISNASSAEVIQQVK
jgi:NADH:ubiquinone oxidoreductase subunit E